MGKDAKDAAAGLKTVMPLKLSMPKLGASTTPPPVGTAGTSDLLRPTGLSMPLSMPQLTGAGSLVDSDDDDGTEAVLMQAISTFFSKREEENKAKRAQLINETLASIKSNSESVLAALAKDGKDTVGEAVSKIAKLEGSMEATAQEIRALSDKYKEDLKVLYNKYSGQYEQLATIKQEATVKVQQRRSGAKRKLSAFKTQAEKALGEMEERLSKMKPKKSPMDLYKALESFNAV